MNKMLTQLTTTFIGMAMAIGVGVAVSMNNKEISPVYAADPTRVYTATGSGSTATLTNSATSASWTIGDNKPSSNDSDRGLQWSKAAAELSFTPNFDVTGLTLDGSSNQAGQTISYKIGTGSSVTVATMTRTNHTDYVFSDFSCPSGSKITINITAGGRSTYVKSITLSYIEGVTWTVSFDMQGHGNQVSSQTVSDKGKVTQPSNPSTTGYTFGGWYKESGCTNAWNFSTDTVTSATTIYAKWTAKASALTFNLNGGSGTAPTGKTATYGIAMPTYGQNAPTKTGHTFGGFYDGSGGTGTQYYTSALASARNWDKDIISGTTLYAKWIPIAYDVTFDVQGHGTAPSNQSINYGSKVTKPSDPTADGYKFKGWYKESTCTNEWDFSNDVVSGATTLYAKWVVTYVVTFDVQGHGTAPSSQIVETGEKVTQPSNPSTTGYTFGGWYKESGCTNTWNFSTDTVTSTTTIYAKWTVNSYTVTFDVQGHGTAPSNQSINYGEKVTQPSAPSEAGFSFGGWYKESSCTNAWNFSTDVVTGVTTLYAKWTDIRTAVTLSAEDIEIEVGSEDKDAIVTSNPTGHTSGYTLSSDTESVATIVDNKIHAVAKGTATITVHIEDDTSYKYTDTTFTVTVTKTMDDNGTGTITFGSADGSTKVNAASVTGDDSQNNTWTIATVASKTYFSQYESYSQIGSSSNPATSITFSTTLSKDVKITHFSAKFGGFSGTAGIITLKIGESTVATDSLNATSDVVAGGDITDTEGTELTVTVTSISKGVKAYYISYTYITEVPVTGVELSTDELNLVPGGTYQLDATVAPENATNKNVSWTVVDADPSGCVTVSESGLVTAVEDGTATVTVTTEDGDKTATCSVTVATPVGGYVNIASSSAMGIVDGSAQEVNFTYGGTFSESLGVSKSSSCVNVSLTDNGDGTGKITISFISAGTSVISFTDGDDPIENEGSTCTVTVVEKLNAINKYSEDEDALTYSAAYTGSEKSSDGVSWTVASDGSQSSYDSTKGIHYGTGSAYVQYITLTSGSSYSNVTSVTVNASTASGVSATVSVTVGGVAFGGEPQAISTTAKNYTFSGSKTDGIIVITITKPSSATNALYCKSLGVNYTSSTPTNLANTNTLVQKQVLDFVAVMNTDLAVCSSQELTTSVWSSLASKYATAKAASADSDLFEEMFKYASSTPRAGDGSATTGDSLQNALARYDYILTKYNTSQSTVYSDFLGRVSSGKVAYSASRIVPFIGFDGNTNTAAFIIVISIIMVASMGAYFYLRKRENY